MYSPVGPANIWVDQGDVLTVDVTCTANDNPSVEGSYTIITASDGLKKTFPIKAAFTNTNAGPNYIQYPMVPGWLVQVSLTITKIAGNSTVCGAGYVLTQAFLGPGADPFANPGGFKHMQLISGTSQPGYSLTWPTSSPLMPYQLAPAMVDIAPSNPAAGSNFSLVTGGTNFRFEIMAVNFVFTTSAQTGNRLVVLELNNFNQANTALSSSPLVQPPSTQAFYSFQQGVSGFTSGFQPTLLNIVVGSIPVGYQCYGNSAGPGVATLILGIQSSDQVSSVNIHTKRWHEID
jgi:hypothetical protein